MPNLRELWADKQLLKSWLGKSDMPDEDTVPAGRWGKRIPGFDSWLRTYLDDLHRHAERTVCRKYRMTMTEHIRAELRQLGIMKGTMAECRAKLAERFPDRFHLPGAELLREAFAI